MSGPWLLFGGPYSNLHATQALLAEAARLGVPPARIVCTGDVAAYCADPAATLDLVMQSGMAVVRGNCEDSLAAGAGDCGCGFASGTACDVLSRTWFAHADASVTTAQRRWMGALPPRIVLDVGGRRLAVIHGGATNVSRFLFPSAPDAALAAEIEGTGCDGVVAGHCGIPFTRVVSGRLWHNPGAIGMPADDGTPRAWFSLLEPGRVRHLALHYDWQSAAGAMRRAGLAAGYADALGTGLWPSDDVLPPAERARRGAALAEAEHAW